MQLFLVLLYAMAATATQSETTIVSRSASPGYFSATTLSLCRAASNCEVVGGAPHFKAGMGPGSKSTTPKTGKSSSSTKTSAKSKASSKSQRSLAYRGLAPLFGRAASIKTHVDFGHGKMNWGSVSARTVMQQLSSACLLNTCDPTPLQIPTTVVTSSSHALPVAVSAQLEIVPSGAFTGDPGKYIAALAAAASKTAKCAKKKTLNIGATRSGEGDGNAQYEQCSNSNFLSVTRFQAGGGGALLGSISVLLTLEEPASGFCTLLGIAGAGTGAGSSLAEGVKASVLGVAAGFFGIVSLFCS